MARPATNHETRKAEIVEAAIKSFAIYGYEGTSNKTIAEEGGFSASLIYHYFPGGKPELFQACIDQFQPLQTFQKYLQAKTDAPPEIYLRQLAHAYLKMIEDETVIRLIRIVMTEAPKNEELRDFLPKKMFPLMAQPLFMYLMKHIATGELKQKHPLTMVMEFFGPLFARLLLRQIGADKNLPLPIPMPTNDEMVDTVVDTFLHGLWSGETPESPSIPKSGQT